MWGTYTAIAAVVGFVGVGLISFIPMPVNVTAGSERAVPPLGTRVSLDEKPLGRVIAIDGTRLAVQPIYPLWRPLVRLYWAVRRRF